ncbi:MAG: ribonuclease P protein component [Gammaproteobacteria bacterium]|nr:ribonuclease P protein component [Gammaproteobacteria bacterium]
MAHRTQLGFPRRVRITKKREIDHVFRNATLRKTFGPIAITGVENKLGFPRLGLAIAKRYAKKATCRNYLKRAIREWFRQNQGEFVCIDLMVSLRQRIEEPQHIHGWLSTASTCLRRRS